MGVPKRKQPKSAAQIAPFVWTNTETAALLAWLDICLETRRDFQYTVAERLKRKWPQREFNYNSCERKVRREWHRIGTQNTKSADIFKCGTQCLDLSLLNDEEERAIEEAKAEFRRDSISPRSRTRSNANNAREESCQTLGRSPRRSLIATIGQREYRGGLKAEQELIKRSNPYVAKRVRSLQVSETPPRKRSRSASRRLPRLGSDASKTDDADTQTDDAVTESARPDRPKTRADFASILLIEDSDSFDEFVDALGERSATISQLESRIATLQQSITERDDNISQLRDRNESLQNGNTEMSEQVGRQSHHISALCREVQDCRTALKNNEKCWRTAVKNVSEEGRIEAIKECEETITTYHDQRMEWWKIAAPQPDPSVTFTEIINILDFIEGRANDWFSACDVIFPADDAIKELEANSAAILQRTLSHRSVSDVLKTIGTRNVVRAMLATALQEWVFESDFHSFDDSTLDLLTMYRRILLGHADGSRIVCNIDLMATRYLLDEPYFKDHILAEKVEELTSRFLGLLTPFLTREDIRPDSTSARCRQIFRKSLELKADLMLTRDRYSMRTITPGTPFDPAVMKALLKDGSEDDSPKKRRRKVMLCLFPALYAYLAEPLPDEKRIGIDRYDMSGLLVESNNFLRSDDRRRKDQRPPLRKAVVLLEDVS